MFFEVLAGTIASAHQAPEADRQAALSSLRELAVAPPPIGFPPEEKGLFWTVGAKEYALEAIDARIAQLSGEVVQ